MVRHATVREVAEELGVGADTIYQWIRNGELRAINVGGQVKPRWRISAAAKEEFERSRSNTPPTPVTRRRSRRSSGDVREFV